MRIRPARAARLALAIVPLVAALAQASELSDDLTARRARVIARLDSSTMLILWSAPVQQYSLDVDYEYRQDSNLYYLTGLTQEDTILVLMPGNRMRREILFLKDNDPTQEHWRGRSLSIDEARARTGIATVLTTGQFEPFITAMLSRSAAGGIDAAEAGAFFGALSSGTGRVALALEPRGLNEPLGRPQDFARRLKDRFAGFEIRDATSLLTDLRMVKTPYEQKVLSKSLEISSDAQVAGMRAARPGAYEYEVKAAIEAVHRARGAVSWSYPSLVGSGPNATILPGQRSAVAGR